MPKEESERKSSSVQMLTASSDYKNTYGLENRTTETLIKIAKLFEDDYKKTGKKRELSINKIKELIGAKRHETVWRAVIIYIYMKKPKIRLKMTARKYRNPKQKHRTVGNYVRIV